VSKISIIGVPIDLGANRRGVDMGPSALRLTGLADRIRKLGYDVKDRGNVDVPLPEECSEGDPRERYAAAIARVCEAACDRVYHELRGGSLPVTLGGDHSMAIGSIAGVARHFREAGAPVGLLWFDAHGDMNTPESTNSGNVHGMALSHVLGMGDPALASIGGFQPKIRREHACLIGVRDLDEREKNLISGSGVAVFTMKDIDRHGISHVIDQAIEVVSRGTRGIHVSFDMDSVDPTVARGVGTPKRGGLTYREAHLCMEVVADSRRLTSMDLVEINPVLDSRNSTAELGCELVLSALGKQII
jgi:arginase